VTLFLQGMGLVTSNLALFEDRLVRTLQVLQHSVLTLSYRGADNYLARPERKQATATEVSDFHISYL